MHWRGEEKVIYRFFTIFLCLFSTLNYVSRTVTVCQRSSDPFYIVSYYIKWVTTSWTHSMIQQFCCCLFVDFLSIQKNVFTKSTTLKVLHKNVLFLSYLNLPSISLRHCRVVVFAAELCHTLKAIRPWSNYYHLPSFSLLLLIHKNKLSVFTWRRRQTALKTIVADTDPARSGFGYYYETYLGWRPVSKKSFNPSTHRFFFFFNIC